MEYIDVETREHVEEAARLATLARPNMPITAEDIDEIWASTDYEKPWIRQLAMDGGRAAASMVGIYAYWISVPGAYYIACLVDPRGPISVFEKGMARMLDWATAQSPASIHWYGRSDWHGQVEFMERSGFVLGQRNPESRLLLNDFASAEGHLAIERLRKEGIEFCTYADFITAHSDDWREILFEFESEILRDVPMPGGKIELTERNFDSFHTSNERNRSTMWLALDGGSPVALSVIALNKVDPSIASTGLTGCRRTHRRRGLATALKTLALERAKERGAKEVWTDNAETNPMFQLNLQLGFRPVVDQLLYVRSFQ